MNDLLRRLLDLPPQASTYASAIDHLHFVVITTTLIGAAVVFVVAIYFVIRYRRPPGHELTPRMQTSLRMELVLIASLQTLFLAFWVVGARQYNRLMTPPPGAMPIYVTAREWMWKFSYPDGRASMDVLTVPVNRTIKLVMTSRDVIHSFYVPAFRMKHDVVPGRYYTAWFEAKMPGTFDVDCAEYCGVGHSRMLGQVQVLSQADFERWLDSHPIVAATGATGVAGAEMNDLSEDGREVAVRRGCLSCHTLDGQRHIGPTWSGLYDSRVKLTDGATVVADEAYLTRSMMDPAVEIVEGYPPVMPTYRGVLDPSEVAALVELIKAVRNAPYPPSVELPKVVPVSSSSPAESRP
jgi:cytochrome c oxidase subunit II